MEEFERLVAKLSEDHGELADKLIRIEGDAIRLNEAVIHLNEDLGSLERKLFGNGQPGVITLLDKRISDMEKWIWRVTGLLSAGFGFTNLVLIVMKYLSK